MLYYNTAYMYLSGVAHFFMVHIYIYILFCFNELHHLPLGRNLDRLHHLLRYSCSTYHAMMYFIWTINLPLFNGYVSMSAGCIADSIGRIYIVELSTYAQKFFYFTLINVVLVFMSRSQDSVRSSLLSSNIIHRTVGESMPMIYPRTFISLWIYMIVMVLCRACMVEMYALSVDLRGVSVWSCYLHITGNPKDDTLNLEQERSISGSFIDLSGNQLPFKSASSHTLAYLLQWRIYMTSL